MEIINVNTVDVIQPDSSTELLGLQNGNPVRINASALLSSSDVLKCTLLTEEEYMALPNTDAKTMYVITGIGDTGSLEITSAYLGDLRFATGGGTDNSGIPIEILELSDYDVTIERGAEKLITASWQPSDATNTTLSWVSNNTFVASVNTGTITGLNKGNCVITVKARSGVKETINVTVIVTLQSLSIEGTGKLVANYDEELTLVPTPEDADFEIASLSSSNGNVTIEKSTEDARKLIAKTTSTAGTTRITAVSMNGIKASLDMTVVPYIITVKSNADETDNSVTSIFSDWTINRKGGVNSYKFTESYMKEGVKTVLQEVTEFKAIPDNNTIQIELYAEFGNKIVDWVFKDDAGNEESITCNILYKEPELIHYSFDVDITCTQAEATNITAFIPYFKYNKKFAYCLRCDDGRPTVWRTLFRYTNRELDEKSTQYVPIKQSEVDALTPSQRYRSPRRLGYTDGCGVFKTNVYDTAGTVVWETNGQKSYMWANRNTGDAPDTFDVLKLKDYGGHLLIHNMAFLSDDPVQPKYENDYTYPLQRDRQIITDNFGYTSITYANPDGDWWYTRPVIKDPKTLLLSGCNHNYDIDPNGIYGKPAHRKAYNEFDDLSVVPLSEIRNTLLGKYVVNEGDTNYCWIKQYSLAYNNFYTFIHELTHNIGYGNTVGWNNNKRLFDELFDVAGANGDDVAWVCSADEVIEYMYYQRVVNIQKTVTSTGCKFTISFDIPDYLSYKTYSLMLANLPENATVSMNGNVPLTYLSKNLKTGLINWGVSPDISERANRYVATFLSTPTMNTLDRAWYFVKQMGELGSSLAAQLPVFTEKPVLSHIEYNSTPTDSLINITTTNSNKEFGEANFLDITNDESFSTFSSYAIPSTGHKFFDELDDSCLLNSFAIKINPNFGITNTYYARLRNIYGSSDKYAMNITLTRVSGVNDPAIEFILPDKFTSDTEVTFTIAHSYISEMRYKLADTFSDWVTPADSITIPMVKGTVYTLVVQGRNNLNELIEKTYTINFTGKQRIILFGNVNAGNVENVGYVNKTYKASTSNVNVLDLDGNSFCTEQGQYEGYFLNDLTTLRSYWGITKEANISEAYWNIPSLTVDDGSYPNSIIVNGNVKNVTLYGGIQPNTTYQMAKYLKNVPAGTYTVRILVSDSKANAANATNPVILRVNNSIQKVTNTTIFQNNNKNWIEFTGVTVDSSGYMLISQYTDVMFTASYYTLPPIVLIEITQTA